MDAPLPEAVAGVVRTTAGDDIDARVAEAVAQGAHLAISCAGSARNDDAIRLAASSLDADWGVGSVSLLDRAAIGSVEGSRGQLNPAIDRLTDTALDELLGRIDLRPLSIPSAGGSLVLLGRSALSRVPSLPPGEDLGVRLERWCAAVSARAFTHLLELRAAVALEPGNAPSPIAPVALPEPGDPALDGARLRVRAAARGLRVHIDGRTLEGAETGTEVHTLQLIRALARRPEVSYVGVNLRGSVPRYAAEILTDPRVHVIEGTGEWTPDLPQVDVFHRPYQPLSREDCALWRAIGARTACHMQDLITYLSPEYHPSVDAWRGWRTNVSRAVSSVDGVFTLSDYVRDQLLREGMRGEPDLVWSAPCGVDHMVTGAGAAAPPELSERRRPFALVLGSSYGHKNVDLAIAAVQDARGRGCDIEVVTAGRQVDGSEGGTAAQAVGVTHLGRNVSSAERNWLLANAALVLFPTSAEGFGLVPFEAAALGTPTVCVTFGALAEHLGELPVPTPDWSVESFARSILTIVGDRDAAAAQVGAISRAASRHTWDRTAGIVLRGYQEMLRRPARA